MNVAGFVVIAVMVTMYVLLDGYDLGVGAISPLIARGDRERAAAMKSIEPFWNGNEVWLISAGAALFALFPVAYASSFSGFYLPFVIVLWLLMFRGIALELREHFASEIWHQFWDVSFSVSSALLIFLFGLTFGNLLRGVPLDSKGYFEGTFVFLLNPYSLTVGIFALVTLGVHGAAFAAMRIDGRPGERATRVLQVGIWGIVALYAAVTAVTLTVHPASRGWLLAMPVLSLGALFALWRSASNGPPVRAFAFSTTFVATLLVAWAGTLFPYLLPAFPWGRGGVTIFSDAPSAAGLSCALGVTIAGIVALAIYAPIVWRRMAGKVRVE